MKERPIIFSGPMVRAILDGRKTQTRRVIKPQPEFIDPIGYWRWPLPKSIAATVRRQAAVTASREWHEYLPPGCCPYGVPGDRLWVRETWQHAPQKYCHCPQPSMAVPCDDWHEGTGCRANRGDVIYRADGVKAPYWRPSIFMPRWASRILLEITDVRVQRVQKISEEDARAEGLHDLCLYCEAHGNTECDGSDSCRGNGCAYQFQQVWNRINYRRGFGWDANPWVWAVTFKVIEARRAA